MKNIKQLTKDILTIQNRKTDNDYFIVALKEKDSKKWIVGELGLFTEPETQKEYPSILTADNIIVVVNDNIAEGRNFLGTFDEKGNAIFGEAKKC